MEVDRIVLDFVSCLVMSTRSLLFRLLPLVLAALLATVTGVIGLGIHRTGLAVPAVHDGDALMMLPWIDAMARGEGWWGDRRLGAPGVQDLSDFPRADLLHMAGLQSLAWVFGDPAVVMNLALILDFPLIVLLTHLALRRLGAEPWPAAAGALLFACLPFHWGEVHHLFLAGYFLVPWQLLPAIALARSIDLASASEHRIRWWDILLAGAGGLAGLYFAYFASYLVVLAGLRSAWCRGTWRPLGAACAVAGMAAFGCCLGYLPTALRSDGPNPAVGARLALESEIYALKPLNLVLPSEGHISGLGLIRHEFNGPHRPLHEAETFYMGALAIIGACGALCAVVAGRRGSLAEACGFLILMLLVLVVPGGLGAAVAYVLPGIRCLGRAGLLAAFFGLATTLTLISARLASKPRLTVLLMTAIVTLGLLDHFRKPDAASARARVADWQALHAFGEAIEKKAGAGALHFQLPHVGYPELQAPGTMGSYDHLAAVLHAPHSRFSGGGMSNRPAEIWCRWVGGLPPRDLISVLAADAWAGIWLDCRGFAKPQAVRAEYEALLGPPLLMDGGERVWFSLQGVKAESVPACPPMLRLVEGHLLEASGPPTRMVVRSRGRVRLIVENPGQPKRILMRLWAEEGPGRPVGVRISGPIERTVEFVDHRMQLEIAIDVPTGNIELQVEALHRPYIPAPLPLHLFTLGVELIP